MNKTIQQIWYKFGKNGSDKPKKEYIEKSLKLQKDNPNYKYKLWFRHDAEKLLELYPKYKNIDSTW